MNTQSNVAFPFDTAAVAPAVLRATRPFFWSVRRELWENRWIYIAPLAVTAVFLFGFSISAINLPARVRALSGLDPAHFREEILLPFDIVSGLMMVTGMFVGAFYCLDTLYGERRDRSILFWKSLPVSDLTTVLAKATIPLVILPLLAFVITVAAHLLMLLLSSVLLLGSGVSIATLWAQLSFFRMTLFLLYHLVTVHALWPAPIYAWLMLVSAWARRAPFLWAVIPVVAIGGLEKLVFHTGHFAAFLLYRLAGGGTEAITAPDTMPMDPTTHLTPGQFLTTPGLWFGLILTATFLVAAARLRRYREPI